MSSGVGMAYEDGDSGFIGVDRVNRKQNKCIQIEHENAVR